jgi:hypothetical protein
MLLADSASDITDPLGCVRYSEKEVEELRAGRSNRQNPVWDGPDAEQIRDIHRQQIDEWVVDQALSSPKALKRKRGSNQGTQQEVRGTHGAKRRRLSDAGRAGSPFRGETAVWQMREYSRKLDEMEVTAAQEADYAPRAGQKRWKSDTTTVDLASRGKKERQVNHRKTRPNLANLKHDTDNSLHAQLTRKPTPKHAATTVRRSKRKRRKPDRFIP